MPKFPLDLAQMVASFVTSIFYGICLGILLTTFFGCLRVLLWSKIEQRFKRLNMIKFRMLIPAILMFVFATLDLSCGLRQNIEAFVQTEDAITYFEKINRRLVYMKMINYVAQTFIGDGILVWRCWVISGRRLRAVIIPAATWAAGTACGIVTCYHEATKTPNTQKVLNSNTLAPFIVTALALTLATNTISTGVIVYRIWTAHVFTLNKSLERSHLSQVMRTMIESGLIYTMSTVVLFFVFATSNNAQFPVSDAIVQIIGITFNIILIRVDDSPPPKVQPFPTLHFQSRKSGSSLEA